MSATAPGLKPQMRAKAPIGCGDVAERFCNDCAYGCADACERPRGHEAPEALVAASLLDTHVRPTITLTWGRITPKGVERLSTFILSPKVQERA